MFTFTDVLQPKEGEELKAIVRKHGITLWPRLLLASVFIVVPFFFLFTLINWGAWGIALLAALVASGLFIALRAFLMWDADVLLITTERLVDVDQRGMLNRVVCEAPLHQLQDIRWERAGITDALWRTGTLRIRASGPTPDFVSPRLSRPERWAALLNELIQARATQRPTNAIPPVVTTQRERIVAALDRADAATLLMIEELLNRQSGS